MYLWFVYAVAVYDNDTAEGIVVYMKHCI